MEQKETKNELQVEDLKKMIRSHQEEEKRTTLIEDYLELFHQFMVVKEENDELKKEVRMYRNIKKNIHKATNRFVLLTLSVALISTTGKFLRKYREYNESKKVASIEKQLNKEIRDFNIAEILGYDVKEPWNIKLGTLLETYIGIDLDDEKVSQLNRLSDVSFAKYQLDSGNQMSLFDEECTYSISKQIRDIIYMDNAELENYNINIEDGYLYANGEYRMNNELFNSYSLGVAVFNSMWQNEELMLTEDNLNYAINTCLKATCCDVLLDNEEKELDFSLARIAEEYDYQLPPPNHRNDRCEIPNVKVKSHTSKSS